MEATSSINSYKERSWAVVVAEVLRFATDPIIAQLSCSNMRYISPKTSPTSERGRLIVEQVTNEFAPALEPFMVHYDNELLLLGFWMASSEAFFSPHLSRIEKERIAVRISKGNNCDYCARAHEQIGWAASGSKPTPTSAATRAAEAEAKAIERVFHYINRMMLVFTHRPNRFLRHGPLLPLTGAIANLRIGPAARREHEQGLSLKLLLDTDPIPSPDNDHLFAWADPIPIVQMAFKHWHALMLETERSLTVSPEAKIYLKQLVFNRSGDIQIPAGETELLTFAQQLIFAPEIVDFSEPLGTLRSLFPTDADWVNFIGWCSYLGSHAAAAR